jgi:hypothetical protein
LPYEQLCIEILHTAALDLHASADWKPH